MKTNSPNVLFNHQAKSLLGKTSQVMKQKLLLILLLVLSCLTGFAQGARTASNESIVVTDVNSVLFPNGTSTSARVAGSGVSTVDASRVRELISNVQQSTYYFEGRVKTYGETPTNLNTELSSLNQLDNVITQKDNIEIVTLRINSASELNSTIDLAAFTNFPRLKYIYFITKINTTSSNIASHIVNYNSRFNLFYKIDKGDSNQ